MRIFVTGLMMFIGGLGVGLGIGLLTGKKDTQTTAAETMDAKTVQEAIIPAVSIEPSSDSTVEQPATAAEPLVVGHVESLKDLKSRLSEIETRLQLLELSDSTPAETLPGNQREIDRQNLQQAGFDDSEVLVITDFFNQQQLQSLEIRDRATREGWIDSADFRQQLRENRNQSALKFSLGEERYDHFLLSQGRNNRVRIDEVMTDSAAQQAGVVAGDVISRYADEIIYNVTELRSATAGGERNEFVSLSVIRNTDELILTVPRGPLGVTVSGIQME